MDDIVHGFEEQHLLNVERYAFLSRFLVSVSTVELANIHERNAWKGEFLLEARNGSIVKTKAVTFETANRHSLLLPYVCVFGAICGYTKGAAPFHLQTWLFGL